MSNPVPSNYPPASDQERSGAFYAQPASPQQGYPPLGYPVPPPPHQPYMPSPPQGYSGQPYSPPQQGYYSTVMTPTEYDATIKPSGPNGQYTVEDYQKMAQARLPRYPIEQYGRCPKDGGEHVVRPEYATSSLCLASICCIPICVSEEMVCRKCRQKF